MSRNATSAEFLEVQTFPHILVYDWDLQKHAKIQWEEIEEE